MHIKETENNSQITRKEYSEFCEALSAVQEYFQNSYSALGSIVSRRLGETSIPIINKLSKEFPLRTPRSRKSSDCDVDKNKEFYGN